MIIDEMVLAEMNEMLLSLHQEEILSNDPID